MSYDFRWAVLWEQPYGAWMLEGIRTTIGLGLVSWFFALLLGIVVGTFRFSRIKPLRILAAAYTEFFRNIPLLLHLFIWYFAAPSFLPAFVVEYLYLDLDHVEFWVVVIGLSVYTSSRVAEQIRSGLNAIHTDQFAAALSTGLTRLQMYRYVILPQVIRIMIPPLTTEFLTTFKNTSLAMTVGVLETTFMSQQVEAYTFHGLEATTGASLVYLVITLIILLSMGRVEKKLALHGRLTRGGSG
jgi:glutamate/aspartate transport system permease protein